MERAIFFNWFREFLRRNKGTYPQNMDMWLDRVDKNHEFIRNILKEEKVERPISISSAQAPLDDDVVSEHESKLNEIIPDFFSKLKVEKDIIKLPSQPSGTHNTIKTAKFLSNEMHSLGFPSITRNKVVTYLAKVGEDWARKRTSSQRFNVTVSTTPIGFILLGHYGPDVDSCFRQNSRAPFDKYILGQSKDTFVMTISDELNQKNICRLVGFLSNDGNVANFTNCYLTEEMKEGDAIEVMRVISETVFNIKKPIKEDEMIRYISNGREKPSFYMNPYGIWSFRSPDVTPISSHYTLKLEDRFDMIKCPDCRTKIPMDQGEYLDDTLFCNNCFKARIEN